ncbi:TPA: hypothetical protein ACIJUC_000147 [Klebsiella aerogenes]
MTKSTITRERLEEIILDNSASLEEFMAITRMALAAMDSEPVAYIFKHPSGKLFWALTDESNKGRRDVMPVYAAPKPAPGNSPVIPDGYVMVPKDATLDMLKAGAKQEMKGEAFQYVWQAMLAAAPQEVGDA